MRNLRRNFDRHTVNLDAAILPPGNGNEHRKVRVLMKDISLGGCVLICAQPIPMGTIWRLRFTPPQGHTHEVAILIRTCRERENGEYLLGAQHVIDPAILLLAGTDASAVASDLQALVDDGARPLWEVHYHISAAEPLNVTQLSAACVRTKKDLLVSESISDCTLDVGGRLIAPKASLAGGTAHVLRGITLSELGTRDHRPTRVYIGQTFSTSTMLDSVKALVAANKAVIATKTAAVDALRNQQSGSLSHADREQLTVMMMELPELIKKNEHIEANARKLLEREQERGRVKLEVGKVVYPGVTIITGDSKTTITKAIAGPVSFGFDEQGEISARPIKPAAQIPVPAPSSGPDQRAA